MRAAVLANPGATWLIGNEPDSPVQDNLLPELYARAYHHLYTLIKSYDATARIGAGGIVQPTPLRFQYLDRVLAAYRAYYHQTLPADLWNIHSYILREITADDPLAISDGLLGRRRAAGQQYHAGRVVYYSRRCLASRSFASA